MLKRNSELQSINNILKKENENLSLGLKKIRPDKLPDSQNELMQLKTDTLSDNLSFEAIYYINTHGIILDLNHYAAGLLRSKQENLLGENINLFFSIKNKQLVNDELLKTFGKEEKWFGESEFIAKSKKKGFCKLVIKAIKVKNKLESLVLFVKDISREKIAYERLKERERLYRLLFEEDLTANFLIKPNGEIISCNKAFIKIFEYDSKKSAIKSNIREIFDDEEQFLTLVKQLKKLKKIEYQDIDLKSRKNKIIYAVQNLLARFGEDGKLSEIQGYIFDDSKRRLLEKELLQAQKMESLGVLAGGIAHDFNNLLSIIINAANMIKLEFGRPNKRLDFIIDSSRRGADLINQLMAFSRKSEVNLGPINVNKTVTAIINILSETTLKNIEIDTSLTQRNVFVHADENQIQQILLNLCINAADAMTDGGRLIITTDVIFYRDISIQYQELKASEYLRIMVKDTGSGIESDVLKRIFEPFFTTKAHGKGTGLGLSVVYGIVKKHDGIIDVESEPGEGTAFYIYLPILKKTLNIQSDEVLKRDLKGGTETVLIVEDEIMLNDLLVKVFELKGYKVYYAFNGEEGFKLFCEHREEIQLVVSDIGMPKMNGISMYRKIRSISANTKLIFISGYFEYYEEDEELLQSVEKIVKKPFSPDLVLSVAREILDSQNLYLH